jgi:hypothetical protein
MNGVSLRARLAWPSPAAESDATGAMETTAAAVQERDPDPIEAGDPGRVDARELRSIDNPHFDTALRLTAIALLLRPMGPWFVRPVILAAAVLVLIFPRALRQWQVWGALAVLTAIRIANDWPLADNHIYLLGYWLLAVSLALRSGDVVSTASTLADASRLLIGLAFAFAVLWKVALSSDFIDGRFFRVTLVTDPRFAAATRIIGGLSDEQLRAAREAVALLPHGAELLDPPELVEPARLRLFAVASTWGVVALETLVAALMLARSRLPGILRHAALLSFCAVTYAFAPVAGFGWLLLVMGLSQVEPRQVWLGRLYQLMFLIVLFYDEVPWAELLLNFVQQG